MQGQDVHACRAHRSSRTSNALLAGEHGLLASPAAVYECCSGKDSHKEANQEQREDGSRHVGVAQQHLAT